MSAIAWDKLMRQAREAAEARKRGVSASADDKNEFAWNFKNTSTNSVTEQRKT